MNVMEKNWKQAKALAKIAYESDNGTSWEDANKYEREDYVFSEYTKLNANNNNNNSENKERKTMMNNNARENRMETLKAQGIDTSKFFSVNMDLPMGAMIQVTMPDGKVQTFGGNGVVDSIGGFNGTVQTALLGNDPIAQSIVDNGYVNNSKLFRRFVTAQTFRMLGEIEVGTKYNGEKTYKSDFDKNLKYKGYMWQFKMTLEELRVLSIIEKKDPAAFEERSQFFTKDVVVALCNQYLRQLKKYIKNARQKRVRKCKGEEYVRLSKFGDVFTKDLISKVYNVILGHTAKVVESRNYYEMYDAFNSFCSVIGKLPWTTPLCPEWKDAYKGAGAAYTLQNMVRFHNVSLGYESVALNEAELNRMVAKYKGEGWRLHEYLKKVIVDNNFDLAKSIEAHKEK